MKTDRSQSSDLPSVMVDYKALIPAVEMLMVVDLHAQFLQHRLVSSFPFRMHRSTYIIQDAHDAWWILRRTTEKMNMRDSPCVIRITGHCYRVGSVCLISLVNHIQGEILGQLVLSFMQVKMPYDTDIMNRLSL